MTNGAKDMTNILFVDVDGTLITVKDGDQYLPQSALDGLAEVRTFGFGDSMNDAEMLVACDEAIVMGDARHGVERYATFRTRSVDDDGIAYALRHFGLID